MVTQSGDLTLLRVGTKTQNVLGSCGDNHRINWGYAYAAAPTNQSKAAIGAAAALESKFVYKGALSLPKADDTRMPRAVADDQPVLAFAFDLGSVGAKAVQRQVIVAYDEIYAIKYYRQETASLLGPQRREDRPALANRVDRLSEPRPLRKVRSRTDGGHDQGRRREVRQDHCPCLSRMRRRQRAGR